MTPAESARELTGATDSSPLSLEAGPIIDGGDSDEPSEPNPSIPIAASAAVAAAMAISSSVHEAQSKSFQTFDQSDPDLSKDTQHDDEWSMPPPPKNQRRIRKGRAQRS